MRDFQTRGKDAAKKFVFLWLVLFLFVGSRSSRHTVQVGNLEECELSVWTMKVALQLLRLRKPDMLCFHVKLSNLLVEFNKNYYEIINL